MLNRIDTSKEKLFSLIDQLANEIHAKPDDWQEILDKAHPLIIRAVNALLLDTLMAKESKK